MSVQTIGNNILLLRKSKGITQEQLAKFVGVSTQAVSKWECGGTPDTELLPLIADYFSVSIDCLFGRNVNDYGDLKSGLAKHIASFEQEDRIDEAIEYCWIIQKALIGEQEIEPMLTKIYEQNKNGYSHSQVLYNSGISFMSLIESMQYFILMPEPKNGWMKGLFPIDEYHSLLEILGNKDVLQCLFTLYQRENKPFTPKLFEKSLGIPIERSIEILEALKRYKLIRESEIELDDTIQKIYTFAENPAFIAFLAIMNEMIKKPNSFTNYSASRNKPYLKEYFNLIK